MNSSDETVLGAFTDEQAARLSGLTVSRLRAWDRQDFFQPSIRRDFGAGPFGRIYSFKDVVCLRTLAELVNEHRIPLRTLRETLDSLFGLDQGRWASESLYVLGKRVYFRPPDIDGFQETNSGQIALQHIPLKRVLGEVKEAVAALRSRVPTSIGKIAHERGVRGSRAIVDGTRIPVETIWDYLDDGASTTTIIKEYPILTVEDIQAAKDYRAKSAA